METMQVTQLRVYMLVIVHMLKYKVINLDYPCVHFMMCDGDD